MFGGLPFVAREALAELGTDAAASVSALWVAVSRFVQKSPDPLDPDAVEAVCRACDDHVDPCLDGLPRCELPAVARLGLFEPCIELMDGRCQFCANCKRVRKVLSKAGLPEADDAEPITVDMVVHSFIAYVKNFRTTAERHERLFQKLRSSSAGAGPPLRV